MAIPETLKLFTWHGIDFDNIGEKEAVAECPFCLKNKFSVDIKTTKWGCFVCGDSGNDSQFLEHLWKASFSSTKEQHYKEFAESRGLLPETLKSWGVARSLTTTDWIVPGYNTTGDVRQLYRYLPIPDKKGKFQLLPTPGLGHFLHGMNLYNKKSKDVYLCEGPWDAMKLWETLGTTKQKGSRYVTTRNEQQSLLKKCNVLAAPGCQSYREKWNEVFKNKNVTLMYDNDHPRKHPKSGKVIEPAAFKGLRRAVGTLASEPSCVSWLKWGEEGYDLSLPNGTDVRDYLSNKQFKSLAEKIEVVPENWRVPIKQQEIKEKLAKRVELVECNRWMKVTNQWRKALKWLDGYDVTLSVMVACAMSTDVPGDQLWVKVMGPASCGKSTLCEAVSVDVEHVLPVSNMRGFNSGFKTDGGGEEDNSLITKVAGKTLILKDGDTLLQSPNLSQILAEARDLYDGTTRTHYRNKIARNYENIRMTWILAGTASLRALDSSELGARFLDCVIMEGIDDEMEDDVLLQVARRENARISGKQAEGDKHKDNNAEILARQLTGGYVHYLRTNANELLAKTTMSDEYCRKLARLGKLVSYMRARPSTRQEENAEREFGARLVSQHMRLAKCLTVVLNKKEVDDEVMRRTKKVALDTARGVTLDICRLLYADYRDTGAEVKLISMMTYRTENQIRVLLRFLRAIGVVTQKEHAREGMRVKKTWTLTPKLLQLFEEVCS